MRTTDPAASWRSLNNCRATPSERGRRGVTHDAGNAYYSYAYNPGLVKDQNSPAYDNLNYLKSFSAFVATSNTAPDDHELPVESLSTDS